MEKQTIIRSAAIVTAGIAASVTGAQYLLEGRSAATSTASVISVQSPQTRNAGFTTGVMPSASGASETAYPSDATFLALSETDNSSAPDIASQLILADTDSPAVPADHCAPQLAARDMIDALIELSVTAPCHAHERLVISHGDLVFSAYTDSNGSFSAFVPALSERVRLDVFLGDQAFLQTELLVPEATAHHRVVLQWTGAAGLGLHAFHRGADFGSAGHLHVMQPFDPEQEAAFLIALGETRGPDPMLAQVYSVPVELAQDSRIELELQFEAAQCGEEWSVYILQSGAGVAGEITEASFAAPPCPSEGGFIVMALPIEAPQHAPMRSASAPVLRDVTD